MDRDNFMSQSIAGGIRGEEPIKPCCDEYIVRGVRYEGDLILVVRDLAICNNEEDAKTIVKALKSTDDAELFMFGYVKIAK